MDTISILSTIQTVPHIFNGEDQTDYSAITYFSDSQSVLKLQGPSTTIYNNTNFASPDFNYPGTLEKDITIPLVGGSIPQGSYILTTTTRVYKTAVPIISVNTGTNSILVNLVLDGNFIPGQSITWTGGANAGTYTVASASTGAFGVTVILVQTLAGSSTTGSLSFFELVTTTDAYTYCYSAPSTVLTLSADCPTARLAATNSTNYSITCEGQSIEPDTATATLILNAPLNSSGTPVYAQTTTLLPTGSTYYTTELWTQTWTGTLTTVLVYTLPSGLVIETQIAGTTSLDVSCDDSLCCMSSCLLNATNTFLAATTNCSNLNEIVAAVVKYNKILGAFMMYSVGVRCGNTTIINTAVANMKSYLADQDCCNDCSDNGQSTQIVAIYNVTISGDTLIVQEGDVYIDISQAVVGSFTTATFTLNVTEVQNLIDAYLTANPSIVTDIVDTMILRTDLTGVATSFDIFVEFEGDTTSGSAVIANVSFISGIDAGDLRYGDALVGPGIPQGAYILSIAGSGNITMSANATATASNVTVDVGFIYGGLEVYKVKRTVSGVDTYAFQTNFAPKNSLAIDSSDGYVQLTNDTASPGTIKFYGTNYLGARGWQGITNELVQPADGIVCAAGSSTDTTLKTVTAATAGTYLIGLTGQFATVLAPTSIVIQIIKNGTIINTNCEVQYNAALSATEYYLYGMTTLEALVDTDVVKLRVTPVGQGVTLGNVSATFVRIA